MRSARNGQNQPTDRDRENIGSTRASPAPAVWRSSRAGSDTEERAEACMSEGKSKDDETKTQTNAVEKAD